MSETETPPKIMKRGKTEAEKYFNKYLEDTRKGYARFIRTISDNVLIVFDNILEMEALRSNTRNTGGRK